MMKTRRRNNQEDSRADRGGNCARGGGSNNSYSQSDMMTDPRLLQAIDEATYEAYVDPYRGMVPYFSVSFHQDNSSDDDDIGKRGAMENIVDVKSPWTGCAEILDENCSTWRLDCPAAKRDEVASKNTIEVVNVDDDGSKSTNEDETESCADTRKGDRAVVLQCGCPTVDKWAMDEWELHNKERAVSKKGGRQGKERKQNLPCNLEDDDQSKALDSGNKINAEPNVARIFCGKRKSDDKLHCPCDSNPVGIELIFKLCHGIAARFTLL